MSGKVKYPRSAALAVAKEVCDRFRPITARLIVAGSLRRRKPEVGDVEILYIPKVAQEREGLFDMIAVNLVDRDLDRMLREGVIEKRENVRGSEMWGPKNKLARHRASGIPVDFFSATEENWWNYLVCRTGPAESNTLIASVAKAKGWRWDPYSVGFIDHEGCWRRSESEEHVFQMLGLPYLPPWDRR